MSLTVTSDSNPAAFQSAFLTIVDAAMNGVDNPASVLAMGGGFTLDDRSYIEQFLKVLNSSIRGDDMFAEALRNNEPIGITFDPTEITSYTSVLDSIISNPRTAASNWSAQLESKIKGRVLCVPEFELQSKVLVKRYRIVALDHVGTVLYILLLTLGKPFAGQLRKCRLDGCGEYFLFSRKIRNYCTAEHSVLGTRALTLKRVSDFRAGSKQKVTVRRKPK